MTMSLLRPRAARATAAVLVTLFVAGGGPSASTAQAADPGPPRPKPGGETVSPARDWRWPVQPFRLDRPFVAPPHEYGPGHRGVDLTALGTDVVSAPASGIVAFAGQVAGRGVLTIDHGDGLVSTLEPVETPLAAGAPVATGDTIGRLSVGGHVPAGALHFGVRLDGAYINPLVLLGGVPRAVLLPCC